MLLTLGFAGNCQGATASPTQLWPPNHTRTYIVDIRGVTDPDGDPVTLIATRILQDEATNTTGDGNTCVDGGGLGTSSPWVRAERRGNGNGRVYEVFFEASDGQGGTCTGSVTLCVPHDQSAHDDSEHHNGDGGRHETRAHGRQYIDDGVRYDSTVCNGPRVR